MIDLSKYSFNVENLDFINALYDDVDNQNEIYLQYGDKTYVLQPSGANIEIYAYGETLGYFDNLDDALLNFKIDGVPLIELVPELDFA